MPVDNSVSVTNNSTTVTGYLTAFVGAEGDLFILGGTSIPVESVDSTSQITLAFPWPGTTQADRTDYALIKTADYWHDNVVTLGSVNELLEKINLGLPLNIDKAGPFSERSTYDTTLNGFRFLATSPIPAKLYVKNSATSGDWSAGILVGPEDTAIAEDSATAAAASAVAAAASETAAEGYATALSQFEVPLVTPSDEGKQAIAYVIDGTLSWVYSGVEAGPGYDVFGVLGQSQAVGVGTGIDPELDTLDPRIRYWKGSGPLANTNVIAAEPLYFVEEVHPDAVTPIMSFARLYVQHTGRKVLIVPAAVSATELSVGGQRWSAPSGSLYLQALAMIQAAMASNPDNVYKGTLWAQGENDSGTTYDIYAAAFDNLVNAIRSNVDTAENSVWVTIQQGGGGVRSANEPQDQSIFRLPYMGFTYTPSDTTGKTSDGLHWNAVQTRLNGQRAYAEGYMTAIERSDPPAGDTWGIYDRWQRHPDIVLESSNRLATRPRRSSGAGVFASIRSWRGYMTGQHQIELKLHVAPGVPVEAHLGLYTVFDFTTSSMVGNGQFSVGFQTDTAVIASTTVTGAPTAMVNQDTLSISVDLDAHKVAFRKNNGSWSSDGDLPAGFTLSERAPVYVGATLPIWTTPGAPAAKVEFLQTPVNSIRSGYSYWGF